MLGDDTQIVKCEAQERLRPAWTLLRVTGCFHLERTVAPTPRGRRAVSGHPALPGKTFDYLRLHHYHQETLVVAPSG